MAPAARVDVTLGCKEWSGIQEVLSCWVLSPGPRTEGSQQFGPASAPHPNPILTSSPWICPGSLGRSLCPWEGGHKCRLPASW